MSAWKDDPSYQAYMKALGFDQGIAEADAARRSTAITAGAELQTPEIERRGELARTGISDSYEDRGFFRGSERLGALADQRAGQTYDLAMVERARADALADSEMSLARELAGLNRQRLNLGIQYATNYANDVDPLADPGLEVTDPMMLVNVGRRTQAPKVFG